MSITSAAEIPGLFLNNLKTGDLIILKTLHISKDLEYCEDYESYDDLENLEYILKSYSY